MTFQNPYQDEIDKLCPPGYRFGTDWMDEFERMQEYFLANNIPPEKHVEAHVDVFTKVRMKRDFLVQKYSWAVPTEEAIRRIAELSPIVDWGAGNGYWAWLLREAGADVDAYSIDPGNNDSCTAIFPNKVNDEPTVKRLDPSGAWTDVKKCKSPTKLRSLKAQTLLLVWPPYDDPMAADCLQQFKGEVVVHVGEHRACTADDTFFDMLEKDWEEVDCIEIPSWNGIHDDVWIWRRC